MSFTEINIYPVKNAKGSTKAFGSFVYNKAFRINFSVVEGAKGLFVSLPREKSKDKEGNEKWFDRVSCISDQLRAEMGTIVLKAYGEKTGSAYSQGPSGEPAPQTRQTGPGKGGQVDGFPF